VVGERSRCDVVVLVLCLVVFVRFLCVNAILMCRFSVGIGCWVFSSAGYNLHNCLMSIVSSSQVVTRVFMCTRQPKESVQLTCRPLILVTSDHPTHIRVARQNLVQTTNSQPTNLVELVYQVQMVPCFSPQSAAAYYFEPSHEKEVLCNSCHVCKRSDTTGSWRN
jgi:hypothetical protein